METVIAPHVAAAPGSYTLTWSFADIQVGFEADRLRSHTDGRLQAMVRVTAVMPGGEQSVPHLGMLNLVAGRSRRELSRDLQGRLPLDSVDWDHVIETSCRLILEREEQGSPVERLSPVANTDVEYLLRPLLLEHLPVVWYAPGGSGKSLLAMYAALLVQNGLPFGGGPTRQANALYLDWEVTREEAARRCTLLVSGLRQTHVGADIKFPFYRRCLGSIQDEASEIAKNIAEYQVGLVIVDSAGAACGGDVMSGELATQLFSTVRKVTDSTNASSVILTHTTKADRREENQRRLPIGSVYFENLARATWEMRPQDTNDSHALKVGIFPRKQNMDRPDPVGLKMSFQRDAILVDLTDASDVTTEQGATQSIILEELKSGPASISELAGAAGTTSGTVSVTLTKLKARGQVANLSRGVWSLVLGSEGRA